MSEDDICKIQRMFRIIQIKKAVKEMNYSKEIIKNNTFEEFTKKIREKSLIKLAKTIITNITNIVKYNAVNILSPQEFLSAFVIYGYPSDVISDGPNIIVPMVNLNKMIVESATNIVNIFDTFLDNVSLYRIYKFADGLVEYKILFDSWKTDDHKKLIHDLTVTFYDLESTIKDVEKNLQKSENREIDEEVKIEAIEYINCCQERQRDILNKIEHLNGKEYFKNYKNDEVVLDDSIKKQIKNTVHAAFWDLFHEELSKEPPKYDRLISLLNEIRDTFCDLVPNRKDIHEEIYENIDIDLIKNMIEHNAFDIENLKNLSIYIISLVKRFQPPEMDEAVNKWEKGMLEHFNKDFEYSDFLVMFFKSVLNMLTEIMLSANKIISEYMEKIPKEE